MYYPLIKYNDDISSSVLDIHNQYNKHDFEYYAKVIPVDVPLKGSERIYPKQVVENAIVDYEKNIVDIAFGELYNEDSTSIDINLTNVSHRIMNISLTEDNYIKVGIKTLNTPNGIILKKLLDEGAQIFLRFRATGDVSENLIVSNLKFCSFDASLKPVFNITNIVE